MSFDIEHESLTFDGYPLSARIRFLSLLADTDGTAAISLTGTLPVERAYSNRF